MSWYYESSGYGSGENKPPWKKGQERDYNYSYHRGGRRAGGGRGGRNNNSGSESESPRRGRESRGRTFVWCHHCATWDWESAWFPCCAGCGRRWGVPKDDKAALEVGDDQDEDKKKPEITKEQREQAAQLCRSLSQVVGFDFTPLLAAHLPAVQVPKTQKEMENQKWAELRDARKDCEKKNNAAKKADQHLQNLQKQLEAANTKAAQAREQAEQADMFRHEVATAYFAAYPAADREAAEIEAGLRPRKQARRGGFDDEEHNGMDDLDQEERKEPQGEGEDQHQAGDTTPRQRSRSPVPGRGAGASGDSGRGAGNAGEQGFVGISG